MALGQIVIMANIVEGGIIGKQAASLTNFANNLEPAIAAGSIVEIGGALFEAAGDEAIAGWAGIAADNDVYIKLTVAGAAATATFTTVAPAWDTAKQGWYSGAERYIGGLYKDAAGDYEMKWLYSPLDTWECLARGATRPVRRKILDIGDWNMDATHYVAIPHGLVPYKIRSVAVCIRVDGNLGREFYPATQIAIATGIMSEAASLSVRIGSAGLTDVIIARAVGGVFDSVSYDSIGYNRGWVTVEYEA